jgi:hypothetical protein
MRAVDAILTANASWLVPLATRYRRKLRPKTLRISIRRMGADGVFYCYALYYATSSSGPTKRMLLGSYASMASAVTCQAERQKQTPQRDPNASDLAPTEAFLTGYDEQHLVT